MIVEYRMWVSVAGVPFRDESKWMPLTEYLESAHAELGPVASWSDETTIVLILASDEPNRAAAAEVATRVVSEALHATGLADRFPTVFQVDSVADLIAA